MKSLFYALSVVAIAAAGYFGWEVKNKLGQQILDRDELVQVNKNLSNDIDQREGLRKEKEDALGVSKDELALARSGLEAAKSNFGGFESTLEKVDESLKTATAEEAEVEKIKDSIVALFPGTPIEDVPQVYEGLVKQQKDLTAEAEKLEDEMKNLKERVTRGKADIVRVQGKIGESKERVATNTFQATITGVSGEWGFVTIGAGEKSGLASDSRLLVQRNGRLIGKLEVSKLEVNRALAEIVPDSMRPGVVLQRGDQVILETTRSN